MPVKTNGNFLNKTLSYKNRDEYLEMKNIMNTFNGKNMSKVRRLWKQMKTAAEVTKFTWFQNRQPPDSNEVQLVPQNIINKTISLHFPPLKREMPSWALYQSTEQWCT